MIPETETWEDGWTAEHRLEGLSTLITHHRGYRCGSCDTVHERHSQAAMCCEPEVFEMETFECTLCGSFHATAGEATCCMESHSDGNDAVPEHLRPIPPRVLEAFGQERLF